MAPRIMRALRGHRGPKPGSIWTGLATYTTDPHIGRPGFYALADDGRTIMEPLTLLTWVDEHPHEDEESGGHYEVADLDQPYYSHVPSSLNPNVVTLEANVKGTSETEAES